MRRLPPESKIHRIDIKPSDGKKHQLTDYVNFSNEEDLINLDPTILIKIVSELLEKSKTLIDSLERSLMRVEQAEKQSDFWRNRYYDFKKECQRYLGEVPLEKTLWEKQQFVRLKEENYRLRAQIHELKENTVKMSPNFGQSKPQKIWQNSSLQSTNHKQAGNYRDVHHMGSKDFRGDFRR